MAAPSHQPWRAAAGLFAFLLAVAGASTFWFFWAVTPMPWFSVEAKELIKFKSGLILQYPFANATYRATPLFSGGVSFMIMWQWCSTLAVVLGATILLWLRSTRDDTVRCATAARGSGPCAAAAACCKTIATRTSHLLRYQVPPRRLLGGLNVRDLLLIALWFAIHAMWLYDRTAYNIERRQAKKPPPSPAVRRPPSPSPSAKVLTVSAPSPPIIGKASNRTSNSSTLSSPAKPRSPPPPVRRVLPLPQFVQNNLAKDFGWVSRLDILLLFFPLARCNFIGWLLGANWETLIKYHRWLGHGTIMMTTIHGFMYIGIWVRDDILGHELWKWNMTGTNNLAGLVSLIGGLLLWVTALPFVRRRLFQLFYATHIFGAIVFMLFAFMHRKDVAVWVMPGIFVYLLDVVLRAVQQAFNSTHISVAASSARLSEDGQVLTLTLPCSESLEWVGGDMVFLNVPAISWLQWHPFTVASSASPSGAGKALVVHIKVLGRWTKRLAARMAADSSPLRLYVSGPYPEATRSWMGRLDRVVLIAGGIGVTPMLGMLDELIRQQQQSSEQGAAAVAGPPTTTLVWMSRSMDELKILHPQILQEAGRGKGGHLDVRLYLTGQAIDASSAASIGSTPGAQARTTAPDDDVKLKVYAAATPACDLDVSKAASPSAQDSRPLSHPYMFSPFWYAVAVILCFGGGFAGLVLAYGYDAHTARTVKKRYDYSYVGMLQFVALGLGAVLSPAALMLGLHIRQRCRPTARSPPSSRSSSLESAPADSAYSAYNSAYTSAKAMAVPASEAPPPSLETFVTAGRPDLSALLSGVADECGGGDQRVGVYVAGPQALVYAVEEACAALNGAWGRRGRAYLELHALTFEM